MSDKYNIEHILRKLEKSEYDLSEKDFYPPYDNRVLESYVENIVDGDNFADYCKYIFDIYEEEGYYD